MLKQQVTDLCMLTALQVKGALSACKPCQMDVASPHKICHKMAVCPTAIDQTLACWITSASLQQRSSRQNFVLRCCAGMMHLLMCMMPACTSCQVKSSPAHNAPDLQPCKHSIQCKACNQTAEHPIVGATPPAGGLLEKKTW